MLKCSLFLFLVGNISPAVSEEAVRKHHKKHRKHHHGHHHTNKQEPSSHHVTWKVSNHTNIEKIPPTAGEYAAVDAINAHHAAISAGEAANVATKVAAHSVDINTHARSALNKAQDVLKEARAGAGGLSVDQKETLKRAETNLARATKTVTYTTGDVKYVKSKSSDSSSAKDDAALERELENKLSKLQGQLDKHESVEVRSSGKELSAMEVEVRALQAKLDAKHADARDAQVQSTKQELSELEAMIKEVELAEANHQVKANEHDELKIELEKLRERVALSLIHI